MVYTICMKVVYIGGPYRAPTPWDIECNVHVARCLAAEVVRQLHELDVFPLTPHANTAHFDNLAPDEYYLKGTLEVLRRCDALLLLPGWERSSGTREEKAEAERLGIPIFYRIEELKFWLEAA